MSDRFITYVIIGVAFGFTQLWFAYWVVKLSKEKQRILKARKAAGVAASPKGQAAAPGSGPAAAAGQAAPLSSGPTAAVGQAAPPEVGTADGSKGEAGASIASPL